MKKRWIPLLLVLLLLTPKILNWAGKWYYLSYYEKTDRYVTTAGTVTYISNSEEWGLNLAINDTTVPFAATSFVIDGENQRIVLEKGILDMLQVGDRVEFISNGWYAGDGYSMPIVGICIDGQWLLEFEEGYENLLEHIRTR